MLKIHITHQPKDSYLNHLKNLLPSEVQFSFGETPPNSADYQIIIDGRPSEALLDASPYLKQVIIPFVGAPNSTFQRLRERPHLTMHNVHHNSASTAEFAMSLMLTAAKMIVPADQIFRAHDWRPRHDPMHSVILAGKTALILGFGAIGQRVARACAALDMRVIALKRTPSQDKTDYQVETINRLHDFLPQATALIICLPLTDETRGLIGQSELDLLPSEATLVNVGRAAIVEEGALYETLKAGKIHAAAFDVWYLYPKESSEWPNFPPSDYPFHELPNMVLSPHRAGGVETGEIEYARMDALAELLQYAARGEAMPNRVDLEAGY